MSAGPDRAPDSIGDAGAKNDLVQPVGQASGLGGVGRGRARNFNLSRARPKFFGGFNKETNWRFFMTRRAVFRCRVWSVARGLRFSPAVSTKNFSPRSPFFRLPLGGPTPFRANRNSERQISRYSTTPVGEMMSKLSSAIGGFCFSDVGGQGSLYSRHILGYTRRTDHGKSRGVGGPPKIR